jgi:drug/metabolite transporter (DMT)-like permease
VKYRELGMMVALAAIWGASYLFIRVAAPVFGPLMLMELRVLIAGVALLIYALAIGQAPIILPQWRRFLALGALNGAAPFALIAAAELYIPASLAAILNATTPLFAAVAAAIWLNEAFTSKRLLGLVVGILGVSVLVGWSTVPLNGALVFATAASLLGSLAYGLGGSFATRAFRGVPPLTMAIGQQFGAAAGLLPFALGSLPHVRFTYEALFNLLALALLSTCIAYLIYYPLLRSVGPTKALSVTFLIPGFGVLWGALFLHEPIGVGTVAGLLIIWSSVTLVTGVRLLPRRRAEGTAPAPAASTTPGS